MIRCQVTGAHPGSVDLRISGPSRLNLSVPLVVISGHEPDHVQVELVWFDMKRGNQASAVTHHLYAVASTDSINQFQVRGYR